jgi:hypothetical protein
MIETYNLVAPGQYVYQKGVPVSELYESCLSAKQQGLESLVVVRDRDSKTMVTIGKFFFIYKEESPVDDKAFEEDVFIFNNVEELGVDL